MAQIGSPNDGGLSFGQAVIASKEIRFNSSNGETVMCLAIPGKLLEIKGDDPLLRYGKVSFGGLVKEINLAYTPEAEIDDYVLVHVGFARSIIDEKEANKVFQYLEEIESANDSAVSAVDIENDPPDQRSA